MKPFARVAAGALAGLLAGTPTVGATEGDRLSEEDVRGFLEPLGEQAEEAVEAGDWRGIQQWIGEHLADGATVAVEGVVTMRGGPTVSYAAALDRADLERLVAMVPEDAVEDFSLGVDVRNVIELPVGGASAQVAFNETGRLDFAGLALGTAPDAPAAVFSTVATCDMRLSGTGEAIRIESGACTASTWF